MQVERFSIPRHPPLEWPQARNLHEDRADQNEISCWGAEQSLKIKTRERGQALKRAVEAEEALKVLQADVKRDEEERAQRKEQKAMMKQEKKEAKKARVKEQMARKQARALKEPRAPKQKKT